MQLTPDEIAFVRAMVIYEDAAVLALDKPPGLSSQGGRGQVNTLDELLWAFARLGHARPRLVHRLDRDTSGVILTAKTRPAAGFLGKAMMARRFEKTYVAVVSGALPGAAGEIDAPLRREEIGREAYMRVCAGDHRDAETASTCWRVLATGAGATLVELKPKTGRMHQLRVHMAHLGCPMLGDVRYGGALTLVGEPVARLMLHAASLRLPHPEGGDHTIQAPLPEDLRRIADIVRNRNANRAALASAQVSDPNVSPVFDPPEADRTKQMRDAPRPDANPSAVASGPGQGLERSVP